MAIDVLEIMKAKHINNTCYMNMLRSCTKMTGIESRNRDSQLKCTEKKNILTAGLTSQKIHDPKGENRHG